MYNNKASKFLCVMMGIMVLFLTLAVPISVHAEDKIPCYIFPVMGATVIESGEKMNTINVMPGTTEVTKNTCYGTNVEENATIRSVIENAFNVMGWQNFDENMSNPGLITPPVRTTETVLPV